VVVTKKELDNAAVAFTNKKLREKVLKTVIKESDGMKVSEKKSPAKK
jgi:hypothetical protein